MGKNNEKGNALFIVLIMLALFAALSFAISRSSQDAGNVEMKEKNSIYASEITAYANAVRNAAEQMIMLKNIPDTNSTGKGITFSYTTANPAYGAFDSQPETEIFNPAGGRITYQKPNSDVCVDASECSYEFSGQYIIPGIGLNTKAELALVMPGITEEVCKQLNKIQGYSWKSIPQDNVVNLERFDGSNYGDNSGAVHITNAELSGLDKFCYQEGSSNRRYIFVYVVRGR